MKKGMNIAFFGSSLISAYWNGAATYYRGILKTLNRHGHGITFYEPNAFNRQENRDISDPEYAKVVIYAPNESGLEKVLSEVIHADILIKASGVGVNDRLLEEELLARKNENQQVIFWDVDAPATLESTLKDQDSYFRKLIPKFDQILTYGGGEPVEKAYQLFGAKQCVSIYNGFDPGLHFPEKPVSKYRADLAFLGNRLPDREKRVEEFFIKVARALPEKNFILGGSGWADKPMPVNINYIGHVPTSQHNYFNASPLAVLNISRESMAKYGYSPATRVFEAAAAGACIITDEWKGIENFFEPGKEILVVRSKGELMDILLHLQKKDAEQIGAAARRRALIQHTYDHRAEHLERIFNHQEIQP